MEPGYFPQNFHPATSGGDATGLRNQSRMPTNPTFGSRLSVPGHSVLKRLRSGLNRSTDKRQRRVIDRTGVWRVLQVRACRGKFLGSANHRAWGRQMKVEGFRIETKSRRFQTCGLRRGAPEEAKPTGSPPSLPMGWQRETETQHRAAPIWPWPGRRG